MAKRLSLTKEQLNTVIGVELLELCQTITEDGSLSQEETIELTKWLDANQHADLPAIEFLLTTIKRIIADRRVTREERKELYRALERVLPPILRKEAQASRHVVEAEKRAVARAVREEALLQQREKREKAAPIASADFMVAGVRYEGRAAVVDAYVQTGDQVYLARDTVNAYSRNAIEVRIAMGFQIGFVPEDYAIDLAPHLNNGCRHLAFVKKVLTGGSVPIPVVLAHLYRHDYAEAGAVLPEEVPRKRAH